MLGLFLGLILLRMTSPSTIINLQMTSFFFFSEATEDEIKNSKATLLCFDPVSRLRVNFFKSEIIGVCDLISFRG